MPFVDANRRPNTMCVICAAPMYRRPSMLAKGVAKFCSKGCRNRVYTAQCHGNPAKGLPGASNPAWKGGVTMFKKKGNYKDIRYLRAPEWMKPMARKDGYIMEHRMVMAEWCGFLLTRTEVVHHVDHNVTRNNRANLELWPDNRSHKLAEHGRFVEGAVNRFCPRVLVPHSSPHGSLSVSPGNPSPGQ